MFRNLTMAAVMVLALATFAACSGGGGGTTTPNLNEGVVGGPCLADGTCNEGLVCNAETKICELASPAAGEEGGACLEDGTCNEGLVCNAETKLCEAKPVTGPVAGEEGGACLEDGTCNAGLVCNAETKICGALTLGHIGPFGPLPTLKCPLGMAFIEGGTFEMGSETGNSDEKPVHSVTVSDYCMDMREFTNGDKAAAVFEGYAFPEAYSDADFTGEKQPLIYVTWNDAKAICEKQGKLLPTEAQWEYAARGGAANKEYGTADGTLTDTNACWKKSKSCPVGSYKPNALGLYDMSGNVYEWVVDWYGAYPASAVTDPTGPATGDYRVVRGGSWGISYPAYLRAAFRNFYVPVFRYFSIGFRCVAAPRTP